MELGCTVCVVCGASVKTGSALSLLSVIYIRAEATYRIMETARTFKSGQEVFSREAFFFGEIFALDLFSIGKCTGSKDNVQCSLKIVFNSGL